MWTLLTAAMSIGSKPLACFVCLVCLWAGTQPALAATWQEHRDAGFVAFANADYMVSAEHLEKALATAHEGQASAQERGVILEKLTTSYLAARWFRRARNSISQWDGILETSPGEPWAFRQRIDRDRLALLVSEVLGDTEPEATSSLAAPSYETAEVPPEELGEAPPFEPEVDVPFVPDVELPIGLAVDQPFEAIKETSAALPADPAAGGYAIHLVSLANQESVDGSWAVLQESYPDILAGKDLAVRQIDLGDRGIFYRIHAGPFSASAKAEMTCEELRSLQQYCAVVDLD
jgi:hypothetical protein